MTRTYYRLTLSAACALAGMVGPMIFLADRAKTGYLLGGLAAALLAWAFLALVMAAEPHLHPGLQLVLGAGAGVLSWLTISLVAAFEVIPNVLRGAPARFDPVWVAGGLAPLSILGVAAWEARGGAVHPFQALASALLRFSVPLFGLRMVYAILNLPKQYRWLFLFTGIMFLVLDGLGSGRDLPLTEKRGRLQA